MKDRLSIFLLSALLLVTISYVQVFQKILADHGSSAVVFSGLNDDTEENPENTSEENANETDQDEAAIRMDDMMVLFVSFLDQSKTEIFCFNWISHYPEIVSPPPQA